MSKVAAAHDAPEELAAALASGARERAMELLLAQHADAVFRYCRRMIGNSIDGDDLAQTVFVHAFSALDRVAQAHSHRAWLLGIARHRCLDRLRASRRDPSLVPDEELAAVAEDVAAPLTSSDPRVLRALDACLDRLDAQSRALLMLRFHDELPYEEISRLVAATPGALRVRLARALPALRECLESKGVTL